MAGNAGMGRPKGSRNRRAAELLALASDGETPVEFGLRIMRDEKASLEQRLQAARFAAPYLHPRPALPSEDAAFELPATETREGMSDAAAAVLHAVADGTITATDGIHLVGILDFKRMAVERLADERRHEASLRAMAERTRNVLK